MSVNQNEKIENHASLQEVQTTDGSYTYFHPDYKQTFKSAHAARTESRFVFWQKGVLENPLFNVRETFTILEMGFGTGLNLDTVLEESRHHSSVFHYHGIDRSRAAFDLYNKHKTFNIDGLQETIKVNNQTHKAELHMEEFAAALTKLRARQVQVDCVFYDAFSPKANPDGWLPEFFHDCFALLNPGGQLVTYSVSKVVKENLTSAGFHWKKYPLPEILNKREALVATKP